jgi:hypothetical protein
MQTASPFRAASASKRRRAGGAEASTHGFATLVARVPPSVRIVAIASFAFVTIAGAMYKPDRGNAPEAARTVREPDAQQLRDGTSVLGHPAQEAQASQEQQRPEEVGASGATPEAPANELKNAESPPQFDPSADGSAEIVIPDDPGARSN